MKFYIELELTSVKFNNLKFSHFISRTSFFIDAFLDSIKPTPCTIVSVCTSHIQGRCKEKIYSVGEKKHSKKKFFSHLNVSRVNQASPTEDWNAWNHSLFNLTSKKMWFILSKQQPNWETPFCSCVWENVHKFWYCWWVWEHVRW